MDITRQLLLDQRDGGAYDRVRVIPADEQEVIAALCQVHPFSCIDFMGVDHNIALGCLAENISQLHHIEAAGIYDVPEHVARTNAWKLVHVPDQDQTGAHIDGPQQGMHQAYVHHRHLINDDYVRVQRIFLIPVKMHAGGAQSRFVAVPARCA